MFESAKKLLNAESEAVKTLTDHLDENFEKAVQILLNHSGKTILCGMGKSGHIAKKIAATFSSIGQPSIFLHPSEGAHGDVGVCSDGDPVLLISKSGSTDEILCLIPTLKRFHSKIISIVGNPNSPIAEMSDVVIDISFAKEADPLQIVPTTSSTVSLAVGDALAAELMSRRSFSKENFSMLHPAGQLGRNLLLNVKDVMSTKSACAMVSPNSTLREIAISMTKFSLGAAVVINDNCEMLGIITEGDMRRALQSDVQLDTTKAYEIMTNNPKYVFPDDTLEVAVKIMENGESQISVLPVIQNATMQNNNPNCSQKIFLGLIRLHDVYRH